MGKHAEHALDWAGPPVIATVAWLLCHTGCIGGATNATDSQQRG